MDNDDAIKWLEAIKEKYIHGGDEDFDEKRKQAIKLAIKALKAVNLLDDLLVIERDGIYRPIKNTTKEECYKAIYEMSKIMEDMREADNDK